MLSLCFEPWFRSGMGVLRLGKRADLLHRKASFIGCNVLKWEDQVALFDLAISDFGTVDVVVGNNYPPVQPHRVLTKYHLRACRFPMLGSLKTLRYAKATSNL